MQLQSGQLVPVSIPSVQSKPSSVHIPRTTSAVGASRVLTVQKPYTSLPVILTVSRVNSATPAGNLLPGSRQVSLSRKPSLDTATVVAPTASFGIASTTREVLAHLLAVSGCL